MKALAILAACLLAASPALAAPGPAPHPGLAPHPRPQPHPGPVVMRGGHGHFHHGGGVGIYAPGLDVLPAFPADVDVEPTAVDLPPPVVLAPPPFCAPLAPARLRHTGPRIIYIGHQPAPTVDGPTVIYGTD